MVAEAAAPQSAAVLYLAEGFSKLTALSSVELGESFTGAYYKPTFSASALSA